MMEEKSRGEQQLLTRRVGSCWGQAGCQDRGCCRQTGRELSVQGLVVVLGGSLAASTCGNHPCDDGKCLGMLRFSGMGIFLVLECWKAAVGQDGFPCFLSLGEFNSRIKPPSLTFPLCPLSCCGGFVLQCPRSFGIPIFGGMG